MRHISVKSLMFFMALSLAVMNVFAQDHLKNSTVTVTKSLKEDAALSAKTGKPIIILFSQANCPFCHRVRVEYLRHIVADKNAPAIVREIESHNDYRIAMPNHFSLNKVTSSKAAGSKDLSSNDLIKHFNIKFYPTVIALNAKLEIVGEPLLGIDTSGFYGAYLDRLIEGAQGK